MICPKKRQGKMLNTQSPIPLYHQLAEILIRRIREKNLLPGDMMPSENEMAKTYGIGRPTVRQAMDILVRKGLVQRKRGSGTFVKERAPHVDLFSLAGTSQAFKTQGIQIRTIVQKGIVKESVMDDPVNPFNEKAAFFLSRLIRDEKGPVLIEDIYLHPDLFPGLERFDMKDRSLAQVVSEQYFLKPISGRQSFKILFPDPKRAEQLEVKNDFPLLEVCRSLDFSNAEDAVFSRLFCRTDRFSFSQNIGKA